MGLFDGVPILGDVEKAWNDNVAKPINDTIVEPIKDTLTDKVVDYVKTDPIRAAKTINDPFGTSITQIWKLTKGKRNIGLLDDKTNKTVVNVLGNGGPVKPVVEDAGPVVVEAIEQGLEESTQPIWERESTVKTIGEDGAKELENTLNPTKWVENGVDNLGVSDDTKNLIKKYLPAAALGGAALLIISALR